MARFDAGQTEINPVQSFDTVKDPVVEQPVALEGLSNLFKQAGSILQEDTDKKKKEVVSRFRGDLLKIADAVDQGKINPQAARSKMRLLYMQNNDNYGSLGDEFSRVYSNTLSQTGMAAVLPEEIKQQARVDAMKDQLTQAGWISPTSTPVEQDAALSEFMTVQAQARKFEARMQTLD